MYLQSSGKLHLAFRGPYLLQLHLAPLLDQPRGIRLFVGNVEILREGHPVLPVRLPAAHMNVFLQKFHKKTSPASNVLRKMLSGNRYSLCRKGFSYDLSRKTLPVQAREV